MSSPSRHGRGDWVSLIDGVRVSRAWMARHTPQLLAAWCDARTLEGRGAVAARILQIAAELESEPDGPDVYETPADQSWRTAERIDARLVRGPDWLPLKMALARAAAAGYDVAARLPALAALAPLPKRHPARELHWRLVDDCPAALPAHSPAEPSALTDALSDGRSSTGCPQIQGDIPPAVRGDAASNRSRHPREGDQS